MAVGGPEHGTNPLSLLGRMLPSLLSFVVAFGSVCADQAVSAEAPPRLVTILLAGPPEAGRLDGRVVALPGGSAEGLRSASLEAGRAVLALPPSPAIWQVEAEVDGYWAQSRLVSIQEGASDLVLDVWSTGTIRGSLSMPREGGELPERFSVRFSPPRRGQDSARLRDSIVACELEEKRDWICRVPAVPLDLALRASGFVSHYRWGVEVLPDRVLDLGSLELQRGASLTGWVDLEDETSDEAPTVEARLELAATVSALQTEADRLKKVGHQTRVSANGFFHFEAIPPGFYDLTVRADHGAAGVINSLQVVDGRETRLREPVVLEYPIDLEVRVEPPLDWLGQLWHVSVFRGSDPSGAFDQPPVFSDTADSSGSVTVEKQLPGKFMVWVYDSQDGLFYGESHDVDRQDEALIRAGVEFVDLGGVVRLGSDPIAASLYFGGRHGAVSIPVRTRPDGEFTTVLPRDGEWIVEIQSAEEALDTRARVDVIPKDDGRAFVEIEIPDTRVYGRVVDASGAPLEGAKVSVRSGEQHDRSRTSADGTFAFRGVPTGSLEFSARFDAPGRALRGDPVSVLLVDENPIGPVELVLRGTDRLVGFVAALGNPVAAATVSVGTAIPRDDFYFDQGTTGLDGRFEVDVSADSTHLRSEVEAPGYGYTVVELPRPAEILSIEIFPGGGELLIDLPTLDAPQATLLYQNGVRLSNGALNRWARRHGVEMVSGSERNRLRLPMMAPAEYRACRAPIERLQAAYRAGDPTLGLTETDCASGYLNPDGLLHLEVSGGDDSADGR